MISERKTGEIPELFSFLERSEKNQNDDEEKFLSFYEMWKVLHGRLSLLTMLTFVPITLTFSSLFFSHVKNYH